MPEVNCQHIEAIERNGSFCSECGESLVIPGDDVGDDTPNPLSQASAGSAPTTQKPGQAKNISVGDESNTYNAEKIVIGSTQTEYCQNCGRRIYEGQGHTYRCMSCGKDPIGPECWDANERKCTSCVQTSYAECQFCSNKVSRADQFSCTRCKKTGCKKHSTGTHSRCSDCEQNWQSMIGSLDEDKVVIASGGEAIDHSRITLNKGQLETDDGRRVAQLKENVWYAPRKQWYSVKPKLLARERASMARLYTDFNLGREKSGTAFWEGGIRTYLGNEYSVKFVYPPNFPYLPIKSYVVDPKIEKSRHIYPDGHLCLFHKDDKTWSPNTTVANVASWTALWLHCYEVWLETGEWPRKEHDQLVVETEY